MTPERLAALVDAARELEAITLRIQQSLKVIRAVDALDPPVTDPGTRTPREK